MFNKIFTMIFGTPEEIKKKNEAYDLAMKIALTGFIERESLSCNKCNSISAPILGTDARYKCTSCGRQFVGARHNINRKIKANLNDNPVSVGTAMAVYQDCLDDISSKR